MNEIIVAVDDGATPSAQPIGAPTWNGPVNLSELGDQQR
jgi:hypothetical protein